MSNVDQNNQNENNADDMIELGDMQVSLEELAGMDYGETPEKRMFQFPKGTYLFEVSADPEPPKFNKLGGKGAVTFNCRCLEIIVPPEPKDCPNNNPNELIGKTHRETFFISSPDSFGYLKSFTKDIGFSGKGTWTEVLLNCVGLKFQAPIQHKPNTKDVDLGPYVNINKARILPYAKRAA